MYFALPLQGFDNFLKTRPSSVLMIEEAKGMGRTVWKRAHCRFGRPETGGSEGGTADHVPEPGAGAAGRGAALFDDRRNPVHRRSVPPGDGALFRLEATLRPAHYPPRQRPLPTRR